MCDVSVILELSDMFEGRGDDPVRLEVDAVIVYADCLTDYRGHRLATKYGEYWIRTDPQRNSGRYRRVRIETNGRMCNT